MSHGDKVLAGLAAQRAAGTFCDVELKAQENRIPAHKNVLASATPYFDAMFSRQFEETNARLVEVKDVSFVGLKNVVDYIYTAKIKITFKNIEDILPAAHMLQMTDLVEECIEWMLCRITKNSCFNFLQFAEKYNIETIEDAITDFVLENFKAVSETKEFTEISKEALCRYLSSDVLKTKMEEYSVYKAARNWILHNKVEDKAIISEIMKNVRFALIPPVVLSEKVATEDLIEDSKECRKMISEAMKYHADSYNQPFYEGVLNKPRGIQGLLVIPNGVQEGQSFTTQSIKHITFLSLPMFVVTDESKSFNTAVVLDSMNTMQIKNFLFLFGSKCDGYQNFTMQYDASSDTWIEMAPVPRESTIGSAIACSENKKEIFLIGGMPVDAKSKFLLDPDKTTANVHGYNIQKNMWSKCSSLPEGSIYSAAITLHDHVYVTGGYSTQKTTDSVHAYDIKAKLWLAKAKMNEKRCQHTLDAINEKLYAVGGRIVGEEHVKSVDVYDVLSNQWTIVLPDGLDVIEASSLALDRKIYIIGGWHHKYSYIYDVDKNKITKLPYDLPFMSAGNVSATLTLPKLL